MNRRRAKRQWRAKRMRNGRARRKRRVPPEEKQPSSFPGRAFWAGPKAVFSGQIKDLGLIATVCNIAIRTSINRSISLSIWMEIDMNRSVHSDTLI